MQLCIMHVIMEPDQPLSLFPMHLPSPLFEQNDSHAPLPLHSACIFRPVGCGDHCDAVSPGSHALLCFLVEERSPSSNVSFSLNPAKDLLQIEQI